MRYKFDTKNERKIVGCLVKFANIIELSVLRCRRDNRMTKARKWRAYSVSK